MPAYLQKIYDTEQKKWKMHGFEQLTEQEWCDWILDRLQGKDALPRPNMYIDEEYEDIFVEQITLFKKDNEVAYRKAMAGVIRAFKMVCRKIENNEEHWQGKPFTGLILIALMLVPSSGIQDYNYEVKIAANYLINSTASGRVAERDSMLLQRLIGKLASDDEKTLSSWRVNISKNTNAIQSIPDHEDKVIQDVHKGTMNMDKDKTSNHRKQMYIDWHSGGL